MNIRTIERTNRAAMKGSKYKREFFEAYHFIAVLKQPSGEQWENFFKSLEHISRPNQWWDEAEKIRMLELAKKYADALIKGLENNKCLI